MKPSYEIGLGDLVVYKDNTPSVRVGMIVEENKNSYGFLPADSNKKIKAKKKDIKLYYDVFRDEQPSTHQTLYGPMYQVDLIEVQRMDGKKPEAVYEVTVFQCRRIVKERYIFSARKAKRQFRRWARKYGQGGWFRKGQ